MLHILVVVDHAVGTSGPHRNVVGSLNALGARDDVSVRLLTGEIDEDEPYAKAENVEVLLGFHPHRLRKVLSNALKVRRAARGCDVVYVPTGLKSFLYAQFARRGRRLVAGPNVTKLPIRRADSPGRIELRWLCDDWLEASRYRRDHVRSCVPEGLRHRVNYIHHALDAGKFSPDRASAEVWQEYGIPVTSLKLLHVGRDGEPRKGVNELMDAIGLLNDRAGFSEVDFVLVGRMSDMTAERAAKHKNVHLLGFRQGDELARIYASADISVIPSSWENMPFSVMESMASGLAVVAGRTGGIPEQVIDGESGLLVDIRGEDGKHKPEAGAILAEAIGKLVADESLRERLGRNARARVLMRFSEERLGAELVACLRDEPGWRGDD